MATCTCDWAALHRADRLLMMRRGSPPLLVFGLGVALAFGLRCMGGWCPAAAAVVVAAGISGALMLLGWLMLRHIDPGWDAVDNGTIGSVLLFAAFTLDAVWRMSTGLEMDARVTATLLLGGMFCATVLVLAPRMAWVTRRCRSMLFGPPTVTDLRWNRARNTHLRDCPGKHEFSRVKEWDRISRAPS